KHAQGHTALEVFVPVLADIYLENFVHLKLSMSNTSMGIGATRDGWAKHMEELKRSLQAFEKLYREHLGSGRRTRRDAFYAK
ncbi:hypothetical protein RA269_28850, partial [Pseudomonas syringae pv. tagetis]